ncbi:hypothetical protein VTP01DRAFT_2645 [Rhizomucor pusillus]|uniref:uncharacterized protein n=1 Tax=Rhizomucor pusillus TaxID=4840 RepID=UPI003744AFBB
MSPIRKSERLSALPRISYKLKTVKFSQGKKSASASKARSSVAKKTVTKNISVTKANKGKQAEASVSEQVTEETELENGNKITLTSSVTAITTFDMEKAVAHLKQADPKLAALMSSTSVADFEKRVQNADKTNPFRSLASSIISQQVSGAAATSIRTRFVKLFDSPIPVPDVVTSEFTWFPTPEMVLEKSIEELRAAGLSQRKAEYIRDLAQKFVDKTIDAEKLATMSVEEMTKLLCSVRGIGQWTVDMFLMLNLGHPDVLPLSDLGVRKGVALHFGLKTKLPTPSEMEKLAEPWRPFRSVASWYMWKILETKIAID